MTERDSCYAICPFCGEKHGDCWEWLTSENAEKFECHGCGKTYVAWAESLWRKTSAWTMYDVEYVTRRPLSPEAKEKLMDT